MRVRNACLVNGPPLICARALAAIVRTRNPEKIAAATIAVDVGGEYDPARHRYDHHQRSFTATFSPAHTVTKLSSAGLIYKYARQGHCARATMLMRPLR